ncbi:Uma2 family endonuclease [Scytonema sp. PCC 10023]|uniref:Uma2 family endonuclease n=1 Tax=Scytonema sp. PCC 10023 TaxID=1680591 RepID=UPI0039C5D9D5
MTAVVPTPSKSGIVYPNSDGKPVTETYDHLYAILTTLEVLRQYLLASRATVLANQFLYYAEGFPKLRVAPDVMIIYDVEPGGRDNYKIWEEKQVPKVIFEMTSKSTQDEDKNTKKNLYEALEVQEDWLFDPKGEWIEQKLQGYRLRGDSYVAITDNQSEPLQLRLAVEEKLIGFYRLDNGQKLLVPDELVEALREAEKQAEQERQRATQLESMLARYREQFGELPH